MARIFIYDNREFPDPDPKLTVDQVRQNMATFFPELANAEVKESKRPSATEPGVVDNVYTFVKRVGTKGEANRPAEIVIRIPREKVIEFLEESGYKTADKQVDKFIQLGNTCWETADYPEAELKGILEIIEMQRNDWEEEE